MSSSKFSVYSPKIILGFSICIAFVVVADFVFTSPLILKSYDFAMTANPLEYSSADFHEQFGFWGHSRQTLYASFVLPPIIGLTLAMTFRRHIKNLLLKNQQRLSRDLYRPLLRWDGIGLKKAREEIAIFPRFLPLLAVMIFLTVLDEFVFLVNSSTLAFMATCGFISYPTWKQIFADATSPQASD